jgi:RimK family alpha-L-glutamate ligase
VGDKVAAAMLRYNPNDFRSNVSNGGKTQAIELSSQQAQVALAACKAIGLDFAGVDLLLSKDGPLVCEVNSNPHFKSTYDCTGVDMSELMIAHIAERI